MSDANRPDEPGLERRLAALPRQIEPGRDLWPAIEAALTARPDRTEQTERDAGQQPRSRRWVWQLAAAFALVALSSLLTAGLLTRYPLRATAPQSAAVMEDALLTNVAFGPSHVLDAEYAAAREELAVLLERRIDAMPPAALSKLEANLAELRRATREINQALELQPGDPLLEELLMNTYQAELGVLANASQLTSMNGALAPMDPARIRL